MQRFDVIIVGAGSAGCVLAGRLSEDPNRRVLLIEAGGSDRAPEVRIPAAFTKLFQSQRDYAYWTAPQARLNDRRLFWPRGKMLGGCSSMNAQLWIRGHRADYEAWAEQAGDTWDASNIERAFRRAERRDSDHYGRSGPLHIEDQREPNVSSRAFLAACKELGMKELSDLNEPHDGGYGLSPVTQHRGQRMSAADAYLRPARHRKNLSVLTCQAVQRVLFEGKKAVGVEYATTTDVHKSAYAAEVILSAGAIGSPQLLMLSGVGPGEELERLGITRVVDSPEVGENLQDHLLTCLVVHAQKPVSLVDAQKPMQLLKYFTQRRGMLTSPVAEALAFVKTRPELAAPDIELIWAPVPFVDHGLTPQRDHGLTLAAVVLQPQSRGVIRLQTADPAQAPHIDPRYLSDPAGEDLRTMVAGLRLAERILKADALAPFVAGPVEPTRAPSEVDLAAFVREQTETLYHPVGTCRMGKDAGSVVDPQLRVRGVSGLSVIDASIMPRINRGHTQAPTVMLAELGAERLAQTGRRATPMLRDAASAGFDEARVSASR